MKENKSKNTNIEDKILLILKKIWVCMIILSIVSIVYLFNSFVTAMQSYHPHKSRDISITIGYRNAPEGTVYVDVLGKIDSTDESYSDFNFIPNKPLADQTLVVDRVPMEIDENSEIARYNEDGYMSLSIHSTDLEYFDLDGSDSYRLYLNCSAKNLYKKYGKYKLAYVGEHGEVLGVTKKASHSYNPNEYDSVFANGDKATYSEDAEPPVSYVAIAIILITIPLTFIVILVNIIDKISWKMWVREELNKNSGSKDDDDNT